MKAQTKRAGWHLALAVTLGSIGLPAIAQSNTWIPTKTLMKSARDSHSVISINGGVFVFGGRTSPSGGTTHAADLFDPLLSSFSTLNQMAYSRSFFPVVPLGTSGIVLAPGGFRSESFYYGTIPYAELFNTNTKTWSSTGRMATARELFTGTELTNGQVLVAGGYNGGNVASAELYTPSTGTFSGTATMAYRKHGHTATLLKYGPDTGKVLVTGGRTDTPTDSNSSLYAAELYTPASGTTAAYWSTGSSAANNLQVDRFRHTATPLEDGRILMTGGYSRAQLNTVATAEVFDPMTGTFTMLASTMSDTRMDHTATLLDDGRVLITGGWNSIKGATNASADIFDPYTNTFTAVASLPSSRHEHAATLLSGNTVLLTGGLQVDAIANQTLNDAYTYTPDAIPYFKIAASPSVQTIGKGASADYAISVATYPNFNATIEWTVDGLPQGAGFSTTSVSGSTTVTVSTLDSTPLGTYNLKATATGGGQVRSVPLKLTVVPRDYSLSLSAATVTVLPGSGTSDTVTVAATGGFSDTVTFTAAGLPDGANINFPVEGVTGSGSTTFDITTAPTTPVGSYSVTITGTGGGILHTTTVTLVVGNPDFSIGASPSSLTVRRGYSNSLTVTVTRTGGFAEGINVVASGFPGGVSGQFTGTSPSTSTLKITATSKASLGTFPVTITGTSVTTGKKHSTTVTLSVTR